MALSVPFVAVNNTVTTTTAIYTVPTNTTAATYNYGAYARDLVVTNSGTVGVSVSFGTVTSAATASSFSIPVGGSVILTQCQVPNGGIVFAVAQSGTASVSVGFGTNVSYV